MSTVAPVHQYTFSVCLFLFGITFTSLFLFGITSTITFQLICWGTYTQIYLKINLPVCLHASLSSNHKDLPVTTTTCIHAHRPTGSLTYRFILFYSNKPFVLTCPLTCCSKYSQIYLSINRFHLCFLFSIWLYMHTYLSTHLLDSVPTDPPENKCTCLF